jgi:hypothetical protein
MNLRANLDGRAVRRDSPEFFDFLVGERDATRRPVLPTVKGANPAVSISNSVDHDVETGRDTALCGACVIVIRWIGNVQRKMKAALRIPAVDLVGSLRRFHVALLFLRPDRPAAQGNAISFEPLAVAKDRQFPGRFFDDDAIDRRSRGQGMPVVVCVEVNSQCQRTEGDRWQSDLANHIGSFDGLDKNANEQTRRVARKLAGGANHRRRIVTKRPAPAGSLALPANLLTCLQDRI